MPPLPPFLLADGSGPAVQQTAVRLAWSGEAFHIRFDCDDRDAWGTFTRRDDPIYQEEAVEVFLAPGAGAPARYFEIEVSPRGVLFDAMVWNPDSERATMRVDPSWDCPGLRWEVGPGASSEDWWATLTIPWAALLPGFPETPLPEIWRANFYRIERPRGLSTEMLPGKVPADSEGVPADSEFSAWSPEGVPADSEFSAWSPTLTTPADFHKPARFGRLYFAQLSPASPPSPPSA
jgi:hypothetical protein